MLRQEKNPDHRLENLCPLVDKLLEDCYCTEMDSSKIQNVVAYCCGNFKACRKYLMSQRLLS